MDFRRRQLDIRRVVGFAPEDECLFPRVVGVEFVTYAGELVGMSSKDALQRAHEVLDYVGLGEARYRKVESYSTGMKQRLKLAAAIVHDPKLLILDEPTNGMDPAGREEILELSRDLAHNKGMSLLFSSHLLPDVEAVCDYVVVLGSGKLLIEGKIQQLKQVHHRCFEVRLKSRRPAIRPSIGGARLPDESSGRLAARARFPRALAAVALASWPPTSSNKFASCGRSAARWKKSSSKRWRNPSADFRSGISTLVRAFVGTRLALAGDYPAGRAQSDSRVASCASILLVAWLPALAAGGLSVRLGIVGTQLGAGRPGLLSFLGPQVLTDPHSYRVEIWTICYNYFLMAELQFSMILMLLVGPDLISQDLRLNALPLYFSRPLRRIDYFLGKLGVIVAFLGLVDHRAVGDRLRAWACCSVWMSTILRDTFPILLGSVGLRPGDRAVGRHADAGAVVAVAQFALCRADLAGHLGPAAARPRRCCRRSTTINVAMSSIENRATCRTSVRRGTIAKTFNRSRWSLPRPIGDRWFRTRPTCRAWASTCWERKPPGNGSASLQPGNRKARFLRDNCRPHNIPGIGRPPCWPDCLDFPHAS